MYIFVFVSRLTGWHYAISAFTVFITIIIKIETVEIFKRMIFQGLRDRILNFDLSKRS